FCGGQSNLRGQHARRVEAGVDVEQLDEAAQEQPGTSQEQNGEGSFRGNEEAPQAMRGAALGAGASALFQDLILDAAARFQRGNKAEEDSRPDGDREGKQQSAEIDSRGDYARQRGGAERDNHAQKKRSE